MLASLKREIALMFLMPKNIYLPLAVYGIIYIIFIISNEAQNSSYFASFIASFITIFIISENTFKQDLTWILRKDDLRTKKHYALSFR